MSDHRRERAVVDHNGQTEAEFYRERYFAAHAENAKLRKVADLVRKRCREAVPQWAPELREALAELDASACAGEDTVLPVDVEGHLRHLETGEGDAFPPATASSSTATALELRAELERALLLLDRIGEYAHNEECQPKNDCENGNDNDACYFDEEVDDHVHDHTSCDCLVWDAATRAKSIRTLLGRGLERPTHAMPQEKKR